VFVNGVQQAEGDDYDLVGSTLVFERALEREGKLGFWRMLLMFLGVAGSYGKNDSVDIVYTLNGKRAVTNVKMMAPPPLEPG
jgi:hypothetical protein